MAMQKTRAEDRPPATGKVWRDVWNGTAQACVLSDSDPASGWLSEAMLNLRGPTGDTVRLSNSAGRVILLEIPEEHRSEAALIFDVDLRVQSEEA